MENNKIKFGKIYEYDIKSGIGKIITKNEIYLFTDNDTLETNLKQGDFVKFRAEKVLDIDRAYFVKKYINITKENK